MSSMLSVRDLHFGVKDLSILNGISFEVEPGETVGIIGPNGSGKTTLFNCLSGFNVPSSGSVHFKGNEITDMPPHGRSLQGLGRVFQNFGIFREMSVLENVIMAIESRQSIWSTFFPWSRQNAINREEAMHFLKEVRLENSAKQRAASLSGGQMRLLEIVRTLAFGADLFLLDEPTAGVSPKMKEDVAHLIQKLRAMKKTVLVIEHDINFIQKFCGRIIVLDVGKLVLDDSPERVRSSSMLKEIYFGSEAA
ncbi:MAG: ABC transporter ATP-binding protein [Oligoflexia bacterium]|nr:ABC transporter ATP-binding protein [Oligoflexia bacterium]